jgi:hypothetical protein
VRIILDTAILVRGHGSSKGLARDLLFSGRVRPYFVAVQRDALRVGEGPALSSGPSDKPLEVGTARQIETGRDLTKRGAQPAGQVGEISRRAERAGHLKGTSLSGQIRARRSSGGGNQRAEDNDTVMRASDKFCEIHVSVLLFVNLRVMSAAGKRDGSVVELFRILDHPRR